MSSSSSDSHSFFINSDEDKSGSLDFDELYEALRFTGLKMTRSELLFIIKGSTCKSFPCWQTLRIDSLPEQPSNSILCLNNRRFIRIFMIFSAAIDQNFDGAVSFDEFVNGFASISEWCANACPFLFNLLSDFSFQATAVATAKEAQGARPE